MNKKIILLIMCIAFSSFVSAVNINQGNGNAVYIGGQANYELFLGDSVFASSWNKSDDGFEIVNLVTPDVYVPITMLECDGLNKVTCVNGTGNLTIQYSGYYKIDVVGSINKGQASQYGVRIYVNETGYNKCYSHFDTSSSQGSTFSISCNIYIAKNEVVNIRIDDHSNPVNDPQIESLSFNILRISN